MKRFLKVLALSVTTVLVGSFLLLAVGIGYFATYGNDDWKQLAVRLVRVATDHDLEVKGEFFLDVSWHPSLTITEFSLTNSRGDDGFSAPRVARLELTLDLPRLRPGVLHVERFRLDGARISIREGDRPRKRTERGRGGRPWALLVSDAKVAESRLVYRPLRGSVPTTLELDSLSLEQGAEVRTLEISGKGSVNGYHAVLSGRMGTVKEFFQPTGPYPVRLAAEVRGARLALEGSVDRPTDGAGLDLKASVESEEVAELLRLVRRDWPPTGSFTAQARLVGDLPRVRLEDLSAEIADAGGSKLLCTGRVTDLSRGAGVDLQLEAQVLNTSGFRTLYKTDLPNLDRLQLKGKLSDRGGDLGVEDLSGSIEDGDLAAEFKGRIGDVLRTGMLPFRDIDLSLSARTPDLSSWSALAGRKLPPLGPASFETRIRDQEGALQFTDVDLRVGPSKEAQVRLTGSVQKLMWEPRFSATGVNFRFDGKADAVSHLLVSRPGELPLDKGAQASGEITDADGSLGLEGAHLRVGSEETGVVLISGGIDDLENLREADLSVEVHLSNLSDIAPLLKQTFLLEREIPSIGPVNGTMEIRDQGGTFGAENIDFRFGSRQDTWIRWAGRVGNLLERKDVDLALDVSANNLTDIGFLVNRDLPEIGPVEASGRLSDQKGGFLLEDLSVLLGRPGGQYVRATGQVRDLKTLEGFVLDLEVSLADLSLIAALAKRELPEAGPVTGTLKIVSENATASAREIDLHVGGRDTVWVDLRGQVGDLREFKKVEILAEAGTTALPLLEPLVRRKLPDIGPVRGVARLEDKDGTLGVEEFRLESGVADRFELELTGRFDDIRAVDALDFDLRLEAKDLSGLAALFDMPLPAGSPVDLAAHFTGSDERGRLGRMDLNIGRTKILGEASYTTEGSKPNIVAHLTSPLAYASDLYLTEPGAEPGSATAPDPASKKLKREKHRPRPREWLFTDDPLPLDWLHDVNLSVTLSIDELHAGAVRFDAVKSELKLRDGRLDVDIVESIAQGGNLEASLDIDGREEVPHLSATLDVTGWESGALQAQFVDKRYIEGQVDGKLDLKAHGHSLREIMASLDGEIVIVMGGGTLRGLAIDLLAANIFRQLLEDKKSNAIPVNCLVEHLEIENGLATAQIILLDTDVTTITGSGTIDLRRERIDILLKPRPKQPKLATIKAPVSIQGDLAEPTVTVESKGSLLKRVVTAVGLGLINPFAAVIPFISPGSLEQHPCAKFLDAGEETPSQEPGRD